MPQIIVNIRIEFLKLKKTFVWWLVVLGAGFMPALVTFIFLTKWKGFIPKAGQNPWNTFADLAFRGMGFMYTALFMVLLICLLFSIEHKNNTWKLLFTLPVSKSNVYFSKLITLIILIAIFYILFIPFWICGGYFVGLIRPQVLLTVNTPDYARLIHFCFHSFIATLGMVAIHFWLSLRIKNMVIPIAIAVTGIIVWVFMFQGRSDAITWLPYAYNYSTVVPPDWIAKKMFWIFPTHEAISLLYFILISGFCYRDFVKSFKG